MANASRKRRTKHKGNAAGQVEVRGRTGRRPTLAERDPKVREREAKKATSAAKRVDKSMVAPSWRSSAKKSAFAAPIAIILFAIVGHSITRGLVGGLIVFFFYVPMTYYLDSFAYKRKMRKLGRTPPRR
jgi:hypothetical protein